MKVMAVVVLLAGVLAEPISSKDLEVIWQLPINIGDDRFAVYQNLGTPDEILSRQTLRAGNAFPQEQSTEYFYKQGLVVVFLRDVVARVVLNTYVDYQGWRDYRGKVVNDVSLADSRETVLRKLGRPSLMKTDPIFKTDKDAFGLPQYSSSYYTWIVGKFKVEIEVANSIQVLDEKLRVTRPKDGIGVVALSEIASEEAVAQE